MNYPKSEKINVAIVDGYVLYTGALSKMVNNLEGYKVSFKAETGMDFIEKIQNTDYPVPQIVLLDLNMPLMDGLKPLIG